MRSAVLKSALVAILLAMGLQGCGKRASLDNPAEAKADPTATAQSGQGKPEGAAAGGHKPFILDGLLR
jgi:predicted small lipoprotein YifL